MDDLDYIPADLSPEERAELEEIRRRKGALLLEIQRLREELREAMMEVEGLENSTEGRSVRIYCLTCYICIYIYIHTHTHTHTPNQKRNVTAAYLRSKTLQKSRHVAMGRKKFNMDPKKGIAFLVENELLRHTPEEIAQFLYKGEGLNKTAIGDYLGERDEFNIRVLQAFVDLHEFTDLNLVQALSLHNPNVRDKPTVERFISMNRGINEGGDLPEELLRNCFELYIPNNRGQLIKACKTEADGRVVEGNHMVYRISAPTPEEKDEWIHSIKSAVSVDPFYEMLAARKKRISLKKKEEQA
ncbi:Cytohesin-2 [Bagarius yarrelli]|uniref:Cytohesin-2 n=1 Tax=Bagarius yarrelli TaxID=175774 RepID=A0A556U1G9_BAGYA|nr:Cytohesin-2 [Bagarius yarrelli]